MLVGRSHGDKSSDVDNFLFEDEGSRPRLIHRIDQDVFSNDPFLPPDIVGVPTNGSELLAMGGDGAQQLWAVGAAPLGPRRSEHRHRRPPAARGQTS